MASALCTLSARETSNERCDLVGKIARYATFRGRHAGLGSTHAIGAVIHDLCNGIAEAAPDLVQRFLATLVFDSIMQKRGDCLILIAAMLDDEGG